MAPVLLYLPKIKSILLKVGVVPGLLVLAILSCSFISEWAILLAALVSAYLLLGEIATTTCWVTCSYCILLLASYLAHNQSLINLPLFNFILALVIPLYFNGAKESSGYLGYIVVLVGVELIAGVMYSWLYLGLCAHVHMLLAVVLANEREMGERSTKERYHNVHAEEEEDVMVRIDRMLERG